MTWHDNNLSSTIKLHTHKIYVTINADKKGVQYLY
jgi:hypothetical protein